MLWQETLHTRAGESGSEGVSLNRRSLGCPAAVHSAAEEDISSHLEEIRMENICVKNKRIKIAIQRKRKLRLLHKYNPCPNHLCSLRNMAFAGACDGSPGAPQQLAESPQEGLHPSGK